MTMNLKINQYIDLKDQQAAAAAQIALRPHWEVVWRQAQLEGDLAGQLEQRLEALDSNLRQLAQLTLKPMVDMTTAVQRFLDATSEEESLTAFCAFANSVVAQADPSDYFNQLTGSMRQWGEAYVRRIPISQWTPQNEAQVWRMLNLIQPWQYKEKMSQEEWIKWVPFAKAFRAKQLEYKALPEWEKQQRVPNSRVLLEQVLSGLTVDALKNLPSQTNGQQPDLTAANRFSTAEEWANYMAQYSLDDLKQAIIQKEASSWMSRMAPAIAGVGMIAILFVFVVAGIFTKGFGLLGGDGTETPTTEPIVTETSIIPPIPDTEPPHPPDTSIANASITPVNEPWVCDAGQTTWQIWQLTNTGSQEATFTLMPSGTTLEPDQFQVWRVDEPTATCLTPSEELLQDDKITLLPGGERATLLVRYLGTEGVTIGVAVGETVLEGVSMEVSPWAGELTAQLEAGDNATSYIVDTTVAEGSSITIPYTITVNIPGEYQLVCQHKEGAIAPVEGTRVTFSSKGIQDGTAQSVSCSIPQQEAVIGEWEALVYPVFGAGERANNPINLTAPPVFMVEAVRHELAIGLVGKPIGLIWGSAIGYTNPPTNTNQFNEDVGFAVTYVITNTGNVATSVYVEILTKDNFDTKENQWDMFITISTSPELITGTFKQALSPDSDVILEGLDGSTITFVLTPPEDPTADLKTFILSLPDGMSLPPCQDPASCPHLYVTFWLNARVKNNVSTNPLTLLFRVSPNSMRDSFIEEALVINELPTQEIVLR